MRGWIVYVTVVALAASCGSTRSPTDAAPPGDGPIPIDAGLDAMPVDGGIDAAPLDAGMVRPEGAEVTSGAGRVQGGTMTLDVQIGHPVDQRPAAGGVHQIEGGAVIKP